MGWPPEDAEWARTVWSEPAWRRPEPAWSIADDDMPPASDEPPNRPERGIGAHDPDTDERPDVLDPADAGESWADPSDRYPDVPPPLSDRPEGRGGYPRNGSIYSAAPQPIRPSRRSAEPVSPPGWYGSRLERSALDRLMDDPAATPPAIPLPRSAPPADRSPGGRTDPLASFDREAPSSDYGERNDPLPLPPVGPSREPSAPPDPAAPSGRAAAADWARPRGQAVSPDRNVPFGRAAVPPVPDSDAGRPPRSGEQPPITGTAPDDPVANPAEPTGLTPPGVFVSRRQAQLDDERPAGPPRHLPPPPDEDQRSAPSTIPAQQPAPAPAPWPTGAQHIRAEDGEGEASALPRRDVDQIDLARSTSATPSRPPAQPVGAPAGAAETEVLPQRVPAEPDVPTAPEPTVDAPAETPELARIATHLRRSDSALPQERPEGFDVNAILGAVREVPGVADASLRTTPAGAHKLRLDLADGADSAEVSRQVARLLQERMGLAAAPPDADGAESMATTPPAPATAPSDTEAGEPFVPRRRRTGTARGRATVVEQPATGLPGVGRVASEGGPVTADPPGLHLTTTESAPSRPLHTGTRPGPRVVIDHFQVSTSGLSTSVDVRLTVGGRVATGVSMGPAVDGYVLRLCATATAAAVDNLLRTAAPMTERGRCFVEHAAVVSLGGCEVATVVVLLVCDGWVEQLAGSALVSGDPRAAVVRATLAGINRRLEALLS